MSMPAMKDTVAVHFFYFLLVDCNLKNGDSLGSIREEEKKYAVILSNTLMEANRKQPNFDAEFALGNIANTVTT